LAGWDGSGQRFRWRSGRKECADPLAQLAQGQSDRQKPGGEERREQAALPAATKVLARSNVPSGSTRPVDTLSTSGPASEISPRRTSAVFLGAILI